MAERKAAPVSAATPARAKRKRTIFIIPRFERNWQWVSGQTVAALNGTKKEGLIMAIYETFRASTGATIHLDNAFFVNQTPEEYRRICAERDRVAHEIRMNAARRMAKERRKDDLVYRAGADHGAGRAADGDADRPDRGGDVAAGTGERKGGTA